MHDDIKKKHKLRYLRVLEYNKSYFFVFLIHQYKINAKKEMHK